LKEAIDIFNKIFNDIYSEEIKEREENEKK